MLKLRADGVESGYGRLRIIYDVTLEARTGQVTCIFGPNGCGKSTLLRTIVGAIPAWQGSIRLGDVDITHMPSHQTLLNGIALMPQNGGVFPALTVQENLAIGAYVLRDRAQAKRAVEEQFESFPRLRERLRTRAGKLSGGEQMMLAIARALILKPKFILFDEPSAGLSPKLVTEVLQRVAALAQGGVGVLMVEQNIKQAMKIADYVYILANGTNRFAGTPADIPSERDFMQMYLGVQNAPLS